MSRGTNQWSASWQYFLKKKVSYVCKLFINVLSFFAVMCCTLFGLQHWTTPNLLKVFCLTLFSVFHYCFLVLHRNISHCNMLLAILSKTSLCNVFTGLSVFAWQIFEFHLPAHSALRNHVVLYFYYICLSSSRLLNIVLLFPTKRAEH